MIRTRAALAAMLPALGCFGSGMTACTVDVPIGHGEPGGGDDGTPVSGDAAAIVPAPSGQDAAGDEGPSSNCNVSPEGTLLATSPTGTSAAFPVATFIAIAVDASSVYWIEMPWSSATETQGVGAVMKVSKNGGAPVQLAVDPGPSWSFAVAGGHVYWGSGGFLDWESASGGTPESLSYGVNAGSTLAADDTDLYSFGYWSSIDGVSILSEPLGSGTITNVMNASSVGTEIMTIAVDAENVYWVGWLGSGPPYGVPPVAQQGLYDVPKAGGAAQLLASYEIEDPSTAGPLNMQPHVVADATGVYWDSPTGLMRLPSVGMAPITLVSGESSPSWGNSIAGLAVDGISLYWLSGGIHKVPIGGGVSTTVVQEDAEVMAVDDTFVYWINACGQVKRIPK